MPLHEAVASGRRELVKWLLDGRPSQVNATNHEGRTPLHIAAATDNADLCRLLLDRGAEVNPVARSSKNEPLTPLDCATSRGHRSTAKYLQMHGGLPANKLSNTQIVIDGAPITTLPTRRVTSTKIDVRDRIRIEKREVVELSSPATERRRFKDRQDSDSTNSSSDDHKMTKRRSEGKSSDRHCSRRRKHLEIQKSFSDGYDTELEGHERDYQRPRDSYKKRSKSQSRKSRSRSEPAKRGGAGAKHHRRYQSGSESSSETREYTDKKKSKRHRKRSKRKSSTSEESSSSESSERRSTKRKGKKTSIHIENDEEKQSVNIVKYKRSESRHSEINDNVAADTSGAIADPKTDQDGKEEQVDNIKQPSETETDTVSVKTNMIVTEAQIHMERQSSQQGGSEITVTMDSSNNVSIETSNLNVSHKDMTEESMGDMEQTKSEKTSKESQESQEKHSEGTAQDATTMEAHDTTGNKEEPKESKSNDDTSEATDQKSDPVSTEKEIVKETSETLGEKPSEVSSNKTEEIKPIASPIDGRTAESSPSPTGERIRKRSFQVLSGPDDTAPIENTGSASNENANHESQEKSSSPVVSFSNKNEVFITKDSEKSSDHLMGEEVSHTETTEAATGDEVTDSFQKLDSSEGNVLSSEDKRKDYTSTTASSTEIADSVNKGLVTVIDGNVPVTDRAVQQVIMESAPEDTALILPPTTPKKLRKTSKDSSSRKSSIYETESYKVLSDIARSADGTTGILKKTSKIDGSLEDDKEPIGAGKLAKDSSYGRVPSVSDNEIYSISEGSGRRKRFRKKGRSKSRITIRSKSENSERGYESSGLMDSGFEPSPRVVQRRITSPRLAAYYQQRNASGRFSGKSDSRIPVRKPGDKNAVDMKSVTQRIQTNMRR